MKVTVKKGSEISLPFGTTGFTVTSGNAAIVNAVNAGNTVKLTAFQIGVVWLTLVIHNDLQVMLQVTVVA